MVNPSNYHIGNVPDFRPHIEQPKKKKSIVGQIFKKIGTQVSRPFKADALSSMQGSVFEMKLAEEKARWGALQRIEYPETALISQHEDDFKTKLEELVNHLTIEPEDIGEANRTFTKLLREVLQTKGYQQSKTDMNDVFVRYIHRLAVAIWNDVKAMDAYQALGKTLLANSNFVPMERELSGADVIRYLTRSYNVAKKDLLRDQSLFQKLKYAFEHPDHTKQAMASEEGWIGKVAALAGQKEYDPHMLVANNPSIQGVTTLQIGEAKAEINNCYGGTPTVGDHISLEFLAAIQAVENNNRLARPDPSIPTKIYYTNFQNLGKRGGEGPRSVAIMKLNELHPDAFYGVTLSKDSKLYKNLKHEGWVGAERFGKEFKSYLLSESSFSLDNRTGKNDGGFYFPGKAEDWEPIFDKIIDQAQSRFSKVRAEQDPSEIRGAYQEYFYTLLQSYIEADLAKQQVLKGVEQPKIMAIRACKENIDRGSTENAKYIYSRLDESYFNGGKQKEGLSLIAGAFHSRPLAVRNRMMHMNRTPQVFSLIEHVSRKALREDTEQLLKDLGVHQMRYKPSIVSEEK